jgi:transposase
MTPPPSGRRPPRCAISLDERSHPEQGFRACLGIIRLAASYGRERLEAAAMRAIDIGARTYGSVKSILANNLDRRPGTKHSADEAPILHSNIRGPRYYN